MRRHKELRPVQRLRQPEALLLRERVLQQLDILRFFMTYVLLEVIPEGLQRGDEARVRGFHVLEGLEFFFYLWLGCQLNALTHTTYVRIRKGVQIQQSDARLYPSSPTLFRRRGISLAQGTRLAPRRRCAAPVPR